MSFTFKDLANNPVGKGSGNVAARYAIIADLKRRLAIMKQLNGVSMEVYDKPDKSGWILFFRILSEHYNKKDYQIYYDTVIEVDDDNDDARRTIADCEIRFISNMPSFGYTYAYTAKKLKLTVSWLESKFPSVFWSTEPKVKNPDLLMGFEKSLMFAAYWMIENKFQYKADLKARSKGKGNHSTLAAKFMAFEKKQKEYNDLKKRVKEDEDESLGIKHGKRAQKPKKKLAPKKATSKISPKSSTRKGPKRPTISSSD